MQSEAKILLDWYNKNHREFPWRKTRDPYKIWISEVMLQQTRAQAVVAYYKNFLKKFPDVEALAKAKENEVLEAWSGLGYYSRARNLYKAAQDISANGFPNNFKDLLKLSGFGDYTARAIASFAFKEKCAVLDANVIRFLSRYHALSIEWWNTKERNKLQVLADEWVENHSSDQINQALIEMGATLCTNTSPACLLCPLKTSCKAYEGQNIENYPLKKKKKKEEIWYLKMYVNIKAKKIALQKNKSLPFLKNQFLCPVNGKQQKQKPKSFSFQHAITHHKIFVKVLTRPIKTSKKDPLALHWVDIKEVKKISPFSITSKAMEYVKKNSSY